MTATELNLLRPPEGNSELFDDPLEFKVPTVEDADFVTATHQLYAIQKLEQDIEKLEHNRDEMIAFFDKRIESSRKNIELLRGFIIAYLQFKKEKRLVTHLGTASLMERDSDDWGDNEQLMEWITKNNVPAVRTGKSSVDKAALKEWCHSNGIYPPTYQRNHVTGLTIKSPTT